MKNSSHIDKEDEIDLIELLQTVWSDRKTILKFVIVFGLIGLFVAVFSEKEYTAQTIVMPQTSGSSKMGNLGGLAAMAGINISGGSSEGISPTLYPKIVSSIPFKRALMKTRLNVESVPEKLTYKEYYQKYYSPSLLSSVKKYTIGLPSVILGLFKSENKIDKIEELELYTKDSICKISSVENKLFKQIEAQLEVNVLDKEGVVNISYSMPNALAAAQMTKASQKLLQDAITDFKIKKQKEYVDFIQNRYDEVKKDFIKKQSSLAYFKDRHQGLIMARSQTQQERLESDYNLSYGIYSELAKQLETQKIKLKENTPVFTIIEPVSVPIHKSKPKKFRILVVWLFLGVVLGIVVIFGKDFLKKFKKNRK